MPESRLTQQQRQFIKQRANGCCEYCLSQAKFSPDPFSIEHIIPRSKGGTSDLDNLAIACQGCNNFKYSHSEGSTPLQVAPSHFIILDGITGANTLLGAAIRLKCWA